MDATASSVAASTGRGRGAAGALGVAAGGAAGVAAITSVLLDGFARSRREPGRLCRLLTGSWGRFGPLLRKNHDLYDMSDAWYHYRRPLPAQRGHRRPR